MGCSHSDRLCNTKTHWLTAPSMCVVKVGWMVACSCASNDANSADWTPYHKQPQHCHPSLLTLHLTHNPFFISECSSNTLFQILPWPLDSHGSLTSSRLWYEVAEWLVGFGLCKDKWINALSTSALTDQLMFYPPPYDQQALRRLTKPNNKSSSQREYKARLRSTP